MKDLIERLEGLTAPCRECDRAIRDALGLPNDYAADWGARGSEVPAAFPYTASIDAAMTLVPDGWWLAGICFCPPDFRTERDKEYSAQIAGPITWGTIDYGGPEEPLYEHESGDASTPAIALCIAALKATL